MDCIETDQATPRGRAPLGAVCWVNLPEQEDQDDSNE